MWIEGAGGRPSSNPLTVRIASEAEFPTLDEAEARLKSEAWPAFQAQHPTVREVMIVVQLQRRRAVRAVRAVNW